MLFMYVTVVKMSTSFCLAVQRLPFDHSAPAVLGARVPGQIRGGHAVVGYGGGGHHGIVDIPHFCLLHAHCCYQYWLDYARIILF